MTEQTKQDRAVEEAISYCIQRLAGGARPERLIADYVQDGVQPEIANVLVDRARRIKSAAFRQQGWKTVGIGAAIAAVGIVITMATYNMAADGGHYVVAYGAVLVGLLNGVRGGWTILTNLD